MFKLPHMLVTGGPGPELETHELYPNVLTATTLSTSPALDYLALARPWVPWQRCLPA
jgi:hypothetical protein